MKSHGIVETAELPILLSPKQLVERHRWLKMGTLRRYLFNREYNGLASAGAVIALSQRKLLIDEIKFVRWIQSHPDRT